MTIDLRPALSFWVKAHRAEEPAVVKYRTIKTLEAKEDKGVHASKVCYGDVLY
ncbi:hypothetical protein BDV30DRAFT_231537 [Aspergillus minisclerotigenes]|uniref:Uncharacterized protein n=1 Tax=Aspergillus minisclerotigenes TaxID=656917 RepID=A0A5N6IMD1_9EURO|nr:hypothetical protein BDV30DRAFT_231537 [Aspergillus minisclerotigenes]